MSTRQMGGYEAGDNAFRHALLHLDLQLNVASELNSSIPY